MFNKKPKKAKLKFINLAEHLALQNDIVNETMDSMLAHVVESGDVSQRSDWTEIQKTSEHFSSIDANTPVPATSVPKPKAANRTSQKSSQWIGN